MRSPIHRVLFSFASSAVAIVAIVASTSAQGVLPLTGPYHFGQIGAYFGRPSGCPTFGPVVTAERGTITFQPAGTFTIASESYEACVGNSSTDTDSGAGSYNVFDNGILRLDHDPGNPGTDITDLMLRADGSAAIHTRTAPIAEAFVVVALKGSNGNSNASLSGRYHVARFRNNNLTRLNLRAELGRITFNGAGTWTEMGRRHGVSNNGTTTGSNYNTTGTYSVAADAVLTVSGGGLGGISPNGHVFFWVIGTGGDVVLTIGVREGSGRGIGTLLARWGFADYSHELGSAATLPNFFTGFGSFDVAATGASTGTYAGTAFEVDSRPGGTTGQTGSFSGTALVNMDGSIQLVDAQSSMAVDGAVAPDGTVLILSPVEPSFGGIVVGVRRPYAPDRRGPPTPGTGGIAPDVSYSLAGGFPILGNQSFGLRLFKGRGGASAALVISLGRSPGIPLFGGTILVDPALVIATPALTLGGAAGAPGGGGANLPLPVPNNPGIERGEFFVQGLVLDPNAPGGIAMTQGVGVKLGR